MRVIAGSRRRILLDAPEGMGTRPTQDRIKETLFNMIGPDIYDTMFLDLFAGSGQMGIEALSRGSEKAVFIESDTKAFNVIKSNIAKTKFDNEAVIYKQDVIQTLKNIDGKYQFDIIFMDPPYNKDIEKEVLQVLSDSSLINDDTVIIVEASIETDFSYTSDIGFTIIKDKIYKTNKHVFLKKA